MTAPEPDLKRPKRIKPSTLKPKAEPVRLVETRPAESEISLRDLVDKIWFGKWIVLAAVVASVALVSTWMKYTIPVYTASMMIAPASDSGAGGLSSQIARYSGLAQLAGVKIPGEDSLTPFSEFKEILASARLARLLADKYGVMQTVYASSWDSHTQTWRQNNNFKSRIKRSIKTFFGLPGWAPPSPSRLASYLKEELRVSEVGGSGLYKLSINDKDPSFALNLLQWLHKEGDALIRAEAEERTLRQIEYVSGQLDTVAAADHRQSLLQLLLDQEKRMMMIRVDLPYAARIVQPPIVSDTPTYPKPVLFLMLSVIGGLMSGVFLVLLIDAMKREERPAAARSEPGEPAG